MRAPIRSIHVNLSDSNGQENALEDIYSGSLDAVILRHAFPASALASAMTRLRVEDLEATWDRPNGPVPGIDLRLLGTGAAPTATSPRGPEAAAYFDSAVRTRAAIQSLFGPDFDPFAAIEASLERVAGRPVQVPTTSDGRSFSACTVRSLPAGEGLLLHHDYHYQLPIYEDLAPRLDTSTLISFFVVLQRPAGGGRLCVYQLEPEKEGDLPRTAHGMLDPVAVHERVPHTFFDPQEGDLIAFGSGRLYHRVEPVEGPRSRVTMGGFLAFDQRHERVLYWS